MPIIFTQALGSSTRSYDSDTIAWRDAVVANGGTVSLSRLVIVDQFIYSEKTSGAWSLTDDYWGFWAENEIQGLTSIKQRRLAAVTNAPTFTMDRDYTFDGLSNYINSGFIATSHAVAMTASNARIAVYERTNVAGNNMAAGTYTTTARALRLRPRVSASTARAEVQSEGGAGAVFTLPAANSQGYFASSRNGATAADCLAYKTGVVLARTVDTTLFGATLPADAVYVGCANNAGTAASFRGCAIGFMAVGAAMSAAQEAAQYNAVQAWATSVGANV